MCYMVGIRYAALGHHPGEGLLLRIEEEVREKVSDFSPQGLTNTLWAYAKLKHPVSRNLLSQVDFQISKTVENFNSQVWTRA